MQTFHQLRGTRYLDGRNSALADFVRRKLHYLDFPEALAFYREVEPTLRPIDQAFLACNDRFYLLVGVLNRVDAKHPWLYDRCREVESDTDGFLDLWAREHYKSTIITFAGILQEIVCDPEITIVVFSHNKSGARKFLGQIKDEIERNTALVSIFPDVFWTLPKKQASRWSVESGLVVRRRTNPKEATVEAHGLIDGMPTGGHWRLRVYDDVITEKVAKNPDMVRKATEQWEMSDNLGAGDDARAWTIGTRYSYADSYAVMLKRGLKPRVYAATDNGLITGQPVFISLRRWAEKVKLQRSTISAQMLQNPMAGHENTFRPEWLRGWDVRPTTINVYIMCDPNKGHSRRSDRTGIAVVAVDGQGMKYLVDGYRHRMSLEDRWLAVSMLWRKWSNTPGVGICKVGYERYGEKTDENYFRERMADPNSKANFELITLNWASSGGQSKADRVGRLEPDFRNGRFLLPAVTFDPAVGNISVGGREVKAIDGQTLWRFDPVKNQVLERPMIQPTKNMQRVIAAGAAYLCAKPIVRRDEDGRAYDVTRALIDEMLLFPFAPKDDMVDAVSRIYDMGAVTPSVAEDREAQRLAQELEEAI